MRHTKLFLCILLLVVSFNSFAQFNNIYLGPEGGPGLAVQWGSSTVDKVRKPIVAGTAGYAFQYNFTKIISIRTSIDYERTGSDYEMLYLYSTGHTIEILPGHRKFDYMTLPVLARATFGKKVNFFINAGPYFGVLLRSVFIDKTASPPIVGTDTRDYKLFDTGISGGFGVFVPIGSQFAVSFEARDNLGLYNIQKTEPNSYLGNIKTNTTNFIFAFIYKLVTRKPAPKQKA